MNKTVKSKKYKMKALQKNKTKSTADGNKQNQVPHLSMIRKMRRGKKISMIVSQWMSKSKLAMRAISNSKKQKMLLNNGQKKNGNHKVRCEIDVCKIFFARIDYVINK